MEYGKDKATNLVEAARQMLQDVGLIGGVHDSIFARRVVQGVLELARVFQDQRFSVLGGRLVVALFSRLARGSFPTPEFLDSVWGEIEKVAKDDPYDEREEKARWFQQRYPVIHWAGDLHDHIRSMTFPRISPDEKRSKEEFAGAPLHREGPKDEDNPILAMVRLSDIKAIVAKGELVRAIMEYHKATGKTLKESRDFVYELRDKMGLSKQKIAPAVGEIKSYRFLDGYGFPDIPEIPKILDGYMMPDKWSGSFGMKSIRLFPENLVKAFGGTKKNEESKVDTKTKTIEIIREFCEDMKSFTSLDISNRVKADGFTARHREVAEFVREAFADGEMDTYGYGRDLINVTLHGGGSAQAYLYHHATVPAGSYIDRAQTAARPSSQKVAQPAPAPVPTTAPSCFPILPPPPAPVAAPVAAAAAPQVTPRLTRVLNTSSVIRVQKGDGRLEVPHVWLARLGWQAGDTVDAIRDGNSLVLKTNTLPGEQVLRSFTVDRWRRIRITTKVLNQTGIHFGTGGQHVATLRAADIKIE